MKPPPDDTVWVDFEVPLHDVDPLGVVWHGNYFKYLDIARTALLRSRGIDGADLIETRHRILVVDARCRYVFPLKYGERFKVGAWITEVHNRIRIAYLVWNLTHDRRSAKAHTVLVTTDADGTLLWETPAVLRERLQR